MEDQSEQLKKSVKVFHLQTPLLLVQKLHWNLGVFRRAVEQDIGVSAGAYFTAVYAAFDFCISAWHVTDWIYKSAKNQLDARYGSLKNYQAAVRRDSDALRICDQLANSSKHFGRDHHDDKEMEVSIEWEEQRFTMGMTVGRPLSVPKYEFTIIDSGNRLSAVEVFTEALAYWCRELDITPVVEQ